MKHYVTKQHQTLTLQTYHPPHCSTHHCVGHQISPATLPSHRWPHGPPPCATGPANCAQSLCPRSADCYSHLFISDGHKTSCSQSPIWPTFLSYSASSTQLLQRLIISFAHHLPIPQNIQALLVHHLPGNHS